MNIINVQVWYLYMSVSALLVHIDMTIGEQSLTIGLTITNS